MQHLFQIKFHLMAANSIKGRKKKRKKKGRELLLKGYEILPSLLKSDTGHKI